MTLFSAPRDDEGTSSRWRWSFLAAIGLLLASGGLAVWQYARFAGASVKVDHVAEVLGAIDRVVSRLVDAETGHRGYLLTGNDTFLEPYRHVDNDVRETLASLRTMVADNEVQRELATRVSTGAESKLAEMRTVLDVYAAGGRSAATARVAEGAGKRYMDQVRADAAAMRALEHTLLGQRLTEAQRARRDALLFGLVSIGLALGLAFVAASVERSFERRRRDSLRQMSERIAAEASARAAASSLGRVANFNRSILDSSGDAIKVIDPDGRVTLINRPGLALMEIGDAREVIGRAWPSLWGENAPVAQAAIDEAVAKGESRFHAFRRTIKGTPKWWDVIVTPIRDDDGAVVSLVTISRDITDQKRSEEERAQLLAAERAARTDAERAVRLKDEFVSTLSHELRTPLNAILGWIGILKQNQTTETVAKAIDVLDRNSRRQSQIIDDLLDMSRIMSGKLRLEVQRLDLPSIIEEAIASAQPAADAKGVRLVRVLGSAAVVHGDAGRLQQVVWNLVSNAIKFTPRGGRVQVTLRKQDSHVHLEVSDSGQGITPDILPFVFDRFRQGDASSTRQHGGLGLGLAIVKSLVEIHGGTVTAASEGEGRGSVFVVRLPIVSSASLASAIDQADDAPAAELATLLTGVRALVVDDEADGRELVKRLLDNAGCDCRVARGAEEALRILDEGFVADIIISDIGMPHQDGYDFIRLVRHRTGAVAQVPAIALTALARVEDRRRALMAGYQTHVAKPVDPTELVAMVASLAGRTGRVD